MPLGIKKGETLSYHDMKIDKPEPLLLALETLRACLDREGIAEILKPTSFTREEHVEVVNALIAGVKKAVRQGATSVCLEADAFLM